MQLNSKDFKVQAIKQERDKFLKSHNELKEHIMALQRSFKSQHTQSLLHQNDGGTQVQINRDRKLTPAKLENLLDEINSFVQGQESEQIDMRTAREVMKQMSSD